VGELREDLVQLALEQVVQLGGVGLGRQDGGEAGGELEDGFAQGGGEAGGFGADV
jgi:hypothetical protein